MDVIRDIVLPRKKDKNNYRIGFMLVLEQKAADLLIQDHNKITFMGHRLLVKMASTNSSTNPIPSQSMPFSRQDHPSPDPPISVAKRTDQKQEHHSITSQPSFRTVIGHIKEGDQEILRRSVIGIT